MRKHKGEIATFLTLGLVIVGAVMTIVSSYFSNQQKNISSNPRASGSGTNVCTNLSSSRLCAEYCDQDRQCIASEGEIERKWCCPKNIYSPTIQTRTPTSGYPSDDSCWLVKCVNGKPQKLLYTDSLSRHGMPLSSCYDDMYKGGGKAVIGKDKAESLLNTLSGNSNEETFFTPTPIPSPETPPRPDCINMYAEIPCQEELSSYPNYQCLDDNGNLSGKWLCPVPTLTGQSNPTPGTEGGMCLNIKHEDSHFSGSCISLDLICDYNTGRCVKPTSTPIPLTETPPTATTTIEPPPATTPSIVTSEEIKTCIPTTEKIEIGSNSILIENQSDVIQTIQVPCDHILLYDQENIRVFRECPNSSLEQRCVYACFNGTSQVNCKGVNDNNPWLSNWFAILNKKNITIRIIVKQTGNLNNLVDTTLNPGQSIKKDMPPIGSDKITVYYTTDDNNFVTVGEYTVNRGILVIINN